MDDQDQITVTVLGSGTSAGVPMIGCDCVVCQSPDMRDKRTRPSVAVHYGGHSFLIDTTPELRIQAVATGLHRIAAVVYTHAHADHIFGLDDVRRYNTVMGGKPLPIYAREETLAALRRAFPYAFTPAAAVDGTYRPELMPHLIEGPWVLGGRLWTPVPMLHGRMVVLGFRIGKFAYCTDCSEIPPASRDLLRGLDVLIIDALRPRPHPTHLSFAQALEVIEDLKPRRAFFTHLTHDVAHTDIERDLPEHIRACYDGLQITVEGQSFGGAADATERICG